jgi:autotransporter-associated beta strand protein
MNQARLSVCALLFGGAFLLLGNAVAQAGSATWKTQPPSTTWNDAANWTPATIPNGPADTATFATSQRRTITPSEPTEVNSIVFSPGGALFTIISGAGAPLTISGTGIVNNSGQTQAFVSPAGPLSIFFTNGASAGEQTAFTNSGANVSGGLGGLTQFSGTASAGSATFTNAGTSQTGEASGGTTEFLDDSTAGQGTFINNGGLATIAHAGTTLFRGNSTAGTGSFATNQGVIISFPGEIDFYDNGSADHGVFTNNGSIVFNNSSTAANGTFTMGGPNGGGSVTFLDTTTAADGTFTLLEDGGVSVVGNASLGNAVITANGATEFGFGSSVFLSDTATADHATIIANGGIFPGQPTSKGAIDFEEDSTAAEATLVVNPASVAGAVGGSLGFGSGASAGNSNITVNGAAVTGDRAEGLLTFSSSANDANATAANATIVATGGSNGGKGGEVKFLRNGLGGTCRIKLLGNSQLDMAPDRTRDLTIGSLEGEGTVFLGGHGLIIGSNNLSTTFSGQINDGQGGSTPPGSLSKIGTGTLELAGPTAYTGGTTVNAGALLVNNNTGSATGTGAVIVNGGTLGGGGIVSGAVTVGTGGGGGAFLAPAFGTNKQVTLTLQSSLTLQADATYTYTFKARTNQARADLVIANGVTINGATIALQGKTQGTLTPGMVLTVISNTSANPITGIFNNLPDGGIVNVNGNNFQASYTGGDGNDLTLTVIP